MDTFVVVLLWWLISISVVFSGVLQMSLLTKGSLVLGMSLMTLFTNKVVTELNPFVCIAHSLLHSLIYRLALEMYLQLARAIDVFRGTQFSEQYVPGVNRESSVLERLAAPALIALALDSPFGQDFLLEGFLFFSRCGQFELSEFNQLLFAVEDSVVGALAMALRVGVVLLSVDLILALSMRHMSGVNIAFESLPIRQLVGLYVASKLYAL